MHLHTHDTPTHAHIQAHENTQVKYKSTFERNIKDIIEVHVHGCEVK